MILIKPKIHWFQLEAIGQAGHKIKVVGVKVRYTGKTVFLCLTHDKVYDVLTIERTWYRIVDDSGEDYLYPPEIFEKMEN